MQSEGEKRIFKSSCEQNKGGRLLQLWDYPILHPITLPRNYRCTLPEQVQIWLGLCFVPGAPIHLLHIQAPYYLKHCPDTTAGDHLYLGQAPQRQWHTKLEVTEWNYRRAKPRPVKREYTRSPDTEEREDCPGPGNCCKAARVAAEGKQRGLTMATMKAGTATQWSPCVQLENVKELICTQFTVTRGGRRACSEKHSRFRPANLLWSCNILPLWQY